MIAAASYGQSSIQLEPQHAIPDLDWGKPDRGDGSSPRREWRLTHYAKVYRSPDPQIEYWSRHPLGKALTDE